MFTKTKPEKNGKKWGHATFALIEEHIFDLAFEVGLHYDIVFGVIVYSADFWATPRARVMPLFENISHEGISI